MKVRVYYNGYENVFIAQYKWVFGIWINFKKWVGCYDGGYYVPYTCSSKEEAIHFLNIQKQQLQVLRERKAIDKERDKKSGAVYEDVI